MTRRIIQIAATPASEGDGRTLFALCDDGSVWTGRHDKRDAWNWLRLPDVPQDEGKQGFAKPAAFRWSD